MNITMNMQYIYIYILCIVYKYTMFHHEAKRPWPLLAVASNFHFQAVTIHERRHGVHGDKVLTDLSTRLREKERFD